MGSFDACRSYRQLLQEIALLDEALCQGCLARARGLSRERSLLAPFCSLTVQQHLAQEHQFRASDRQRTPLATSGIRR